MKRSFKQIIAFCCFGYLLFASLLFIGVLNANLDALFAQYANQRQERRVQQILTQVSELYQPANKAFNMDALEVTGVAALQDGLILHVQTTDQEIDWDISAHRIKECRLMLEHMAQNMNTRYPGMEGRYMQSTYPLTVEQEQIGTLTIGYWGPWALNDLELGLIGTLNRTLMMVGLGLLLGGVALGSLLAMRLIKPIGEAVHTTGRIAQGEYGVQIQSKTAVREMQALTQSINHMSAELLEKERQKRRLTADVAHELRTPLCNLQSHMEAVLDGVWEPGKDVFRSCYNEIERLTGLVNRLRELTAYEDGKNAPKRETLLAKPFLQAVLNDFSPRAKQHALRLSLSVLPASARLSADPAQLKQCIVNLISNAIRYTPEGGTVDLRYRQKGGDVSIEVEDSGAGIAPEELPNIFERFYRVESSRSAQTGGMGIGLSITKSIVEMHGGKMMVRSQIDIGSTFTIYLPNAAQAE